MLIEAKISIITRTPPHTLMCDIDFSARSVNERHIVDLSIGFVSLTWQAVFVGLIYFFVVRQGPNTSCCLNGHVPTFVSNTQALVPCLCSAHVQNQGTRQRWYPPTFILTILTYAANNANSKTQMQRKLKQGTQSLATKLTMGGIFGNLLLELKSSRIQNCTCFAFFAKKRNMNPARLARKAESLVIIIIIMVFFISSC